MANTKSYDINPNACINLKHPWNFRTHNNGEVLGILWLRIVRRLSSVETTSKLYTPGPRRALTVRVSKLLGEWKVVKASTLDLSTYHPLIQEIGRIVSFLPFDTKRITSKELSGDENRRLDEIEDSYFSQPVAEAFRMDENTPIAVTGLVSGPTANRTVRDPTNKDQLPKLLPGTFTIGPEEFRRLKEMPLPTICPFCCANRLRLQSDHHGYYLTCICGAEIEILSETTNVRAASEPPVLQADQNGYRYRQPSHGKIRL